MGFTTTNHRAGGRAIKFLDANAHYDDCPHAGCADVPTDVCGCWQRNASETIESLRAEVERSHLKLKLFESGLSACTVALNIALDRVDELYQKVTAARYRDEENERKAITEQEG